MRQINLQAARTTSIYVHRRFAVDRQTLVLAGLMPRVASDNDNDNDEEQWENSRQYRYRRLPAVSLLLRRHCLRASVEQQRALVHACCHGTDVAPINWKVVQWRKTTKIKLSERTDSKLKHWNYVSERNATEKCWGATLNDYTRSPNLSLCTNEAKTSSTQWQTVWIQRPPDFGSPPKFCRWRRKTGNTTYCHDITERYNYVVWVIVMLLVL